MSSKHNPKVNKHDEICYMCVLDFEATCWDDDGKSRYRMEIIEFPSVLVEWNITKGTTRRIGEFQEYCKPIASRVSQFCTGLTGITQDMVNKGEQFPDTFKRHHKWLIDTVPGYASGNADVYIITVGKWDISTQLPRDLKRWGMNKNKIPKVYKTFYDIKDEFVYFMKPKNKRGHGMKNMLRQLKLTLDGRHHSGIDDCRNTAKILEELIRRGLDGNQMREYHMLGR